MNVNIFIYETENKDQIEKLLLINLLGVMDALIENLITLEEAENIFFTPYTMEILQEKKLSDNIINIIHLGTELEDVLSIMPDKYESNLLEIKFLIIELLKIQQEIVIENKVLKNNTI